jgi:hypothetical protein
MVQYNLIHNFFREIAISIHNICIDIYINLFMN